MDILLYIAAIGVALILAIALLIERPWRQPIARWSAYYAEKDGSNRELEEGDLYDGDELVCPQKVERVSHYMPQVRMAGKIPVVTQVPQYVDVYIDPSTATIEVFEDEEGETE